MSPFRVLIEFSNLRVRKGASAFMSSIGGFWWSLYLQKKTQVKGLIEAGRDDRQCSVGLGSAIF